MNKILTNNNNELYNKCDLIYYEEGKKIANLLINTALFYNDCCGLASNQVGLDKNIFIAKVGKNNTWKSFINSEIISKKHPFKHQESCMSFPNKSSNVIRYNSVTIKHQIKARNDNNGSMYITETFTGFNSCIILHEFDHINGKTIFCDNK